MFSPSTLSSATYVILMRTLAPGGRLPTLTVNTSLRRRGRRGEERGGEERVGERRGRQRDGVEREGGGDVKGCTAIYNRQCGLFIPI